MIQGPLDRRELEKYTPIQDRETSILLQNFLESPGNMDRHIHRYTLSTLIPASMAERGSSQIYNCSYPGADVWTSGHLE